MYLNERPTAPISEADKQAYRNAIPLDTGLRQRIAAIDPHFAAELDRLHLERESENAMRWEFFHDGER
ncbi:MAG: hypothetical protein ACK5S9_09960 [Roseiflexaceae bacterium]